MANEIRKKDAREKIMLGGLIVKAGLRDADISFIFGVLLNASNINSDSVEYKNLKKFGEENFLKK